MGATFTPEFAAVYAVFEAALVAFENDQNDSAEIDERFHSSVSLLLTTPAGTLDALREKMEIIDEMQIDQGDDGWSNYDDIRIALQSDVSALGPEAARIVLSAFQASHWLEGFDQSEMSSPSVSSPVDWIERAEACGLQFNLVKDANGGTCSLVVSMYDANCDDNVRRERNLLRQWVASDEGRYQAVMEEMRSRSGQSQLAEEPA